VTTAIKTRHRAKNTAEGIITEVEVEEEIEIEGR
jgi:hypothetical protein